jgi:N-methylhydantoinase A/oxoprolinase/acetone carboxylase beta subunit
MGCLALRQNGHDAVLLDIGGTTTDIAILADGAPLLAPYGVTVLGRPTLIRALNTRSVGLGGDSEVRYAGSVYSIGPKKKGPPMALGGDHPTPTDAMIVLGRLHFGSLGAAKDAMLRLVSSDPPEVTAEAVLSQFTARIKEEADLLIEEVFSRPVYSVSALLNRKRLRPVEVVTVGGPALAMQESLSRTFDLPCIVPEHFEVANAIGAGRTRPSLQATLYADTADQSLSIPEISYREKIGNTYSMKDAEDRLTKVIRTMALEFGMDSVPEVDFLERQEMNTIHGFRTTGKILSIKAQLQPGLEMIQGVM